MAANTYYNLKHIKFIVATYLNILFLFFSVSNSVSQLFGSFEGSTSKEQLWDAIPDRDWKLLAALARKREEEAERERLAEQFQKMWLKEKEEREMVCNDSRVYM